MSSLKRNATSPTRPSATPRWTKQKMNWTLSKAPSRLGTAILLAAAPLWLSASANCAVAQTAQSSEAPTTIEPNAIDALKKMSAYLKTLKSFQVTADVTNDDVLDDGEIVQNTSKVDLLAAKPNRLRMDVTSDDKHRLFLYDGKTFTVWGRLVNYYASVPAPATIGKLLGEIDDKYDIKLPLTDLFTWGDGGDDVKKIKGATDIGPSTVDDITCEHYAFRQDGADWQIWIQLGEFPLPRKLVIRTLTDEARPQHTDTLTWNLAPSFNDDAFTFTAPPDAKRIVLAEEKTDATATEQ